LADEAVALSLCHRFGRNEAADLLTIGEWGGDRRPKGLD
jgi:hypothetical protein